MKVRLFLITPVLLLFSSLSAQHVCGTDEYYQQALSEHPEIAQYEKEYNENVAQFAKQPQNRATKYIIPVVFHVIHTNGAENISREQILDQLRIINEDFSFTNNNKSKIRSQFVGVAADAQIEFALANIDPNGNCTEGINRIYSPLGVEVDRTTEDVKQLIQWNYQKYLNIWVVTSIQTDQNGIVLGYAQFPWMPDKSRDGIVIRHDRVGTIGTGDATDSGRTLTHEIGHWLGLYHTFQDGCFGGDLIDDTPPVSQAQINANCPSNGNSCTNDNPDLLDQWENYMDYSDGSCMAMFTLKQKTRMHGFLTQSPRSFNVSAANLLATGITLSSGAPIANFTSSQKIVCAGTPVTFYDISCKASVTARSWTLPGSSVPSSTDPNPTVVYQTPGKYKVTLLVQNSSGSNSKVVDEYIQVISKDNAASPNFEEGFEEPNPETRGFVSISPKPWTVFTTAAYTGTNCFRAPVNSADPLGTTYSFVLPSVDLLSMSSSALKLTFYTSYAPSGSGISEVLRIFVSTDCGNSFKQILERSGTGLAYSGAPVTSNFVPTAKNQWKLMGVTSLSALGLNTEKMAIFRIDVVSGQGNPVYIDNVNISPYFAGVESASAGNLNMNLYPNPTSGKTTLEYHASMAGQTDVKLYDMAGRCILDVFSGNRPAGENVIEITVPETVPGALYYVKLNTQEGQITKPITFAP